MNTFITPQWVTNDTATHYNNNIKLVGQFDRQWNDAFRNKPGGAKIGNTVDVRIQERFIVNEGQALVIQPILNSTVPISINHQFHVGMGWSSAQMATEVEEVQSRYTKPAGIAMANKADVIAGQEVYKSVYWSIGTPGTAITDNEIWTDAVALLANVGVPGPYIAVLDPKTQSKILNANMALFNPQKKLGEMFNTGQFSGPALGIDEWYVDPNVPTHVTGTFTSSTPLTNGAGQTGSSLITDGWGTYALKEGCVFTIAGVNAVNPLSYVDTGELQQFVLTADLAGSTTATFSISPAIITSGPLQTVVSAPADGAALAFVGSTGTVAATMATQSSKQSLLFNPGAFAFVTVDLPENLPGANVKMARSKAAQVTMRWVEQYNIQTDQNPSRVDMLIGVAPVLPAFAIRIWS